jgi:hypothetical protein
MHGYRHFWKLLAVVASSIAIAALAIRPAISNDSTAELTTGGLVFTKNTAIVMREERLFISLSVSHVRYVFFNKSDKDVHKRSHSRCLISVGTVQRGNTERRLRKYFRL